MAQSISRHPLRAPAFDPKEPRYWDPRDLETELRRTFQVCHECRMCVGYCGSFPLLFAAVDREVDAGRAEGAETLDDAVVRGVSDHCWQCKLCFSKCPYTPDEGAREALDFPRLMAREKAQRARREGIPLVDRLLGEPQLLGSVTHGFAARQANLVNANRLVRKVVEAAAGISAEFSLPPFAEESFSAWWRGRGAGASAARAAEPRRAALGVGGAAVAASHTEAVERVVLFATCYGEHNFPEVARAATLVLEHQGIEVIYPEALTCCGMPNLDGGDVEAATAKMRHNLARLLPHVRRGARVVVPGPTCGYTMKKEWPVYVGGGEAVEVAAATSDLMEFLEHRRRRGALRKDFPKSLGKVAYHAACHLRAQKVGTPGAKLLATVPGTEVRVVERCSAVDGTWGMKARHYEEGRRYARSLVAESCAGVDDGERVVSDCSLAGQRVLGERGVRVAHPVMALAEAYGLVSP